MIGLLNSAGAVWAEYFGLAIVQNTVFLGVVFLVLHLLRNASANVKVVVGSIGVLKLLLPPFLPATVSLSSFEAVRTLPQTTSSLILGATVPVDAGSAAAVVERIDVLGIVFGLWVVFVLGYVCLAVASTVRLAWKLRIASEVDDVAALAITSGRGIRVFRCERIGMPLCLGVFPRKIFVPATWDQWGDECRRTVLQHEMAHIDRRDGIFQAVQILVQAVYFFHPLVWLLNRRLNEYREMACDDASAGFRVDSRIEYSRCLVTIAESVMQNPVGCESASALLERKHELMNRVAYQIKGGITMSKRKASIVLVALALVALPLSWYYSDATSADATANAVSAPESQGKKHVSAAFTVVEISISGKGKVAVNGKKTTLDDFEKQVQKSIADTEETIVIAMVCDDGVPMETVFKVQNQLRKMDLMKVSYATSSGKDLNLMLPALNYKDTLKKIPEEHISTLAIKGKGMVYLDGRSMKTTQLEDAIRKLLADDGNKILSLEISEAATYGDFVTVLDLAKSADAPRIVILDPTG